MRIQVLCWNEIKPEEERFRHYMNQARLGSYGVLLEERQRGFSLYAMHIVNSDKVERRVK